MHLNFEFKARVENLHSLEEKLQSLNPHFIGEDHQKDTYFNVTAGRLKLREGTIENALIHYQRNNTVGAKESQVILYQHVPDPSLKEALLAALSIKVIVEKKRKIYLIENVKFHFDTIEKLGYFIEVEAIDREGKTGLQKLKEQCSYYAAMFSIKPEDFIAESYSDLLLQMHENGSLFPQN